MEQQAYRKPPAPARQPFPGRAPDLPPIDHPDWRRGLREAILNRVVPRLSEPGRAGEPAPAEAAPGAAVTRAEVVRFAELVLAGAVADLIRCVHGLRSDGLPVEAVMLQLLAPAARHLGDLWLADRLSFFDVTAGLGRLQGVLRALDLDVDGGAPGRGHGRAILLAPVPGEQHVFGLSVLAAFFRRAGWAVTFEPRIAFDDLLAVARAERFAAIGLSVAGDRFVDALPGQVEALRRASLNPGVILLAGGPAVLADPDLGRRAGADAAARDATEAVAVAEALAARSAAACGATA